MRGSAPHQRNEWVRRNVGVYSIESILLRSRLVVFRSLLAHPKNNIAILSGLLGSSLKGHVSQLDSQGLPVSPANPWLQHCWCDVCLASDQYPFIAAALSRKGILGLACCPKFRRCCFRRMLSFVSSVDPHVSTRAHVHRPLVLPWSYCAQLFRSSGDVARHVKLDHARSPLSLAVVTNVCPWCERVFSN
jgi:hypothetical protein